MQFPFNKSQRSEPTEQSMSGSRFLKEARGRLADVIAEYSVPDNLEEFDSLEAMMESLEAAVWGEAERLLKESYRNGSRGRGKSR